MALTWWGGTWAAARRWAQGRLPAGGLSLGLTLGLLSGCAQTPTPPACRPAQLLHVGTEAGQLQALQLNACTGQLRSLGVVAQVAKPRWLLAHPQLPLLYATEDGPGATGQVLTFAVQPDTGALQRLQAMPSGGAGPTHLALSADTGTLLVANFGAGSAASLAVGADGRLQGPVSTVVAHGSGPHRRQAGPHAHGVGVAPGGAFAWVPDLGTDRVWVHALDLPAHRMTQRPDSEGAWVAPPGSGPRRAVLAANGRQVWVLHELTAELQVLDWDAASGTLRTRQTVALSSPGYAGNRSGAELLPSVDGRWLYVANRGEHQLLVYRVAPDTSELTLVQRLPSGGQTPWAMAIDPSGRWLLVAHQGSGNLALWRIDPRSGQLSDSGERAAVPAPLSLMFQP